MQPMIFKDQLSKILVEGDGVYTILHLGVKYPPDNVTCSNEAVDFIVRKLTETKGKYQNVFISGEVDYKARKDDKDRIKITNIALSY